MASFVRKLARGKTVDIGTGSGTQAFAAAENNSAESITAVDINPAAVAHVRAKIRQGELDGTIAKGRMTMIESDMFAHLEGELFDTIICNPPYLPDDDRARDIALDGGPAGYEWTERFLEESMTHLVPNGQILMLFSNLTNKDRVDGTLRRLGFAHEILGEMVVGMFERLYVYRIWRNTR
ncbi:TPA: methyltransferase [Candidatus Woesearchaeota archaeon]|nr:methyltransferase [Candidatus Woesearchaeota archaeon]